MRPLIIAIALLPTLAVARGAPVFVAEYDGNPDMVSIGGTVPGELLEGTTLTAEGLEGGGLLVGRTGGVSYSSQGFPIDRGCLQMWVRSGFMGNDDVRRWFFCDMHQRFKVFKYHNGHLYFQVRADERGHHAHAPVNWEPGEWHHVACLWDNINSGRDDATLRLAIDGSVVSAFRGKLTIPKIGPKLFVGCNSKGGEAAESVIDQLKVFDEPRLRVTFPRHLVRAHDPDDYALMQLGATASASTQILGSKGRDYPAEAVINGTVTGPYWASDFIFKTAKGPEWFEVDLGEARELGCIKVYMMTARLGTLLDEFTVSILRDGEWVTVADVQGYQAQMTDAGRLDRFAQQFGVYRVDLDRITTRRLRVTVPGTVARIREIEALPPKDEAAPLTGKLEDPSSVIVFDFGSNASPVADGCLPVTETSVYSDDSGYGWVARTPMVGIARGQGYDVTRDFVAGNAAPLTNCFRVKVPNGQYAVGVITGDTEFEVQPFEIDVEHGQAAKRIATADRCEAARFNAVVRVADSTLDIQVRAERAWLISAVVVAPLEKLAEADARLTQIEHEFAFGDPGMMKGLRRSEPDPPAEVAMPTDAERKRGYLVFTPSSVAEQVWPNLPPGRGSKAVELRAWCTPGEYEPLTFAVNALKALTDVRVTVSALEGPTTLDASLIDVRVVRCWPQRYKSQRKTEWAVMPELLRPQGHFGQTWVSPGTNRQFWITVHVPQDAKPGEYQGTVTIEAANAGSMQLPIKLTVYPFRLRWPKPMAWGIYYYPERSQPRAAFMSHERLEDLVRADLRDLREHGLNAVAINAGPVVNWGADPPSLNFSEIKWVMGLIMATGGFTGPLPVYMPSVWKADREDRDAFVRRFVAELERLRKKEGWPELLYYPVDEPFRGDKLDQALPHYEAYSKVDGIRTYCTVSQEAGQRLAPFLNVRCHATSAATGYWWPAVHEAAMKDGDEFWWYSNCTREYPAVMRFKAGFHHWKSRATGQTYWHYRAVGSSAFCDFDAGPGDHITSYPGVDGPVPTIQWECHREGIDDARYAYTLELLLNEGKETADPKLQAVARRASAVLASIREQAHIDLRYYEKQYGNDLAFHYLSDWPPAQYDRNRRALADATIELLAAGATGAQ